MIVRDSNDYRKSRIDVSNELAEGQCPKSDPSIGNGGACRWLAGHEKAGLPHTLESGLWWHDEESLAFKEMSRTDQMKAQSQPAGLAK
jgi:hypothetical protein